MAAVETYRGVAYPWNCDSMGHMNTQFYAALYDGASFHFLSMLAPYNELKARGLGIEQSFDSALFIHRAVNLLTENLIVGALLALICVWWFMREWRATLLIASAIPVCLLATFGALDLGGRSLNVISLAGLAFAVGMVGMLVGDQDRRQAGHALEAVREITRIEQQGGAVELGEKT